MFFFSKIVFSIISGIRYTPSIINDVPSDFALFIQASTAGLIELAPLIKFSYGVILITRGLK